MNQSAWQRRLTVAFATAVMTLSMTAVAQTAGDPGSDNGKGPRRASSLYIVEMVDAPVLGYTGGVPGINRTKPNRGQKIDPLPSFCRGLQSKTSNWAELSISSTVFDGDTESAKTD